jgi:hypothetical protein
VITGAGRRKEALPWFVLDLDSLDLDEIASALADQIDYDYRWLINSETGEIVFWTADTGIDGTTRSIWTNSTTWAWLASTRCRPGSGIRT